MPSTYLDLTNNVLKRLNQVELTSSSFASARGIHANAKLGVNNALKKINTQKWEWPFNATSTTQLLVVGQTFYNFPVTAKTIDWDSFYLQKSDPLGINTTNLQNISKDEWYKWIRPQDLDADPLVGRGIPEAVFEYTNRSFGITPLPDAAYTAVYNYFLRYTDLVDYDDQATVPTEFDYVIEDGAMHYCYMMMDNEQRSMSAEALFRQGIADMVAQYLPKDPYAYSNVVNQGGDSVATTSGFYWGE